MHPKHRSAQPLAMVTPHVLCHPSSCVSSPSQMQGTLGQGRQTSCANPEKERERGRWRGSSDSPMCHPVPLPGTGQADPSWAEPIFSKARLKRRVCRRTGLPGDRNQSMGHKFKLTFPLLPVRSPRTGEAKLRVALGSAAEASQSPCLSRGFF